MYLGKHVSEKQYTVGNKFQLMTAVIQTEAVDGKT